MRSPRLRWIGVVFAIVATSPDAAADEVPSQGVETPERRASRVFLEGKAAFEAGDFRRAATAFEAAYAVKSHHAALWNAARAWQRAGEDVRAARLLEQFLREAPVDAPDRDLATAVLAEALKRIGRVELHGVNVQNVKLDGAPHAEPVILVAPGEHIASAESVSGGAVQKAFTVRGGETVSITLMAPERTETTQKSRSSSSRPFSPWVLVVGGAFAAGGSVLTVIFGLETLNKRDAFLDGDKTAERLDSVYASQTRTNIALGVTVGVSLLTVGAALFLVDWKSRDPQHARW